MSTGPQPTRPTRSWQEELSATGNDLLQRVEDLVREGNVRRVVIKAEDGRTILELPLTLGVVGALLAPQLAALGAVAGLVTRCTLTVEREGPPPSESSSTPVEPLRPDDSSQPPPG